MSKFRVLLNSATPGRPEAVIVEARDAIVTQTGDLIFGNRISIDPNVLVQASHGFAMGWWERFEMVEEPEDEA